MSTFTRVWLVMLWSTAPFMCVLAAWTGASDRSAISTSDDPCAVASSAAISEEADFWRRDESDAADEEKSLPNGPIGGAGFAFAVAKPWRFTIVADSDDGTEINDAVWYPNGRFNGGNNYLGKRDLESCKAAFRFRLDTIFAGQQFAYARLILPAGTVGQVNTTVSLEIVGVDLDGVGSFAVTRPSQLPKTFASVDWDISEAWPLTNSLYDCTPLERHSPDIAAVINEIIARPGWGSGTNGKTLAIVVRNDGTQNTNYVTCEDYRIQRASCPGKIIAPTLELYPDLRSTFIGPGLLGRPTNQSVTFNAFSLLPTETYVAYGAAPSELTQQTEIVSTPGGTPIETVIDGLHPDTRCYYQLRFRSPGQTAFQCGQVRTFHTQRPPGSSFVFGLQADSHLHELRGFDDADGLRLYGQTLANLAVDQPDFLIDMGDTFFCEAYVGRDVLDYEEAVLRVLAQRPYLDRVCHSAPFFLVLGNHEGEQGWRRDGTPDNVAIWATNARKAIYPLPEPDGFYSGNSTVDDYVGLREDYYAWEWGDALFVVIDPFWNTMINPHGDCHNPGSGNNWDWTLGQTQYNWLCQVLADSDATFKMVFTHHVTGGTNTYGRGGIEAASHALGGKGSYEWGGENLDGTYAFDDKRPGWGLPIHDVMVANGVKIFFHGHDHVFVKQVLAGIVYQECPQPSDAAYSMGLYGEGGYVYGDALSNTGHLRVTVEPTQVTVDYVRAYLPGEGPNGEVAYSYTVVKPAGDTQAGKPGVTD
ncbi:MAG: metallophosphoesterase [Phycisphaerae bacterium]|nr:metallophosphoesterase [Phycisphaerae bacterium]